MPDSRQRFTGRVAVVTGAASGIGRATALLFAGEGARVAAVDRNQSGAEETAGAVDPSQRRTGANNIKSREQDLRQAVT